MSAKIKVFPQYRKLSNEKSFYEILSDKEFTEIQLIGSRYVVHKVIANQYPEMLRIMDMLAAEQPYVFSNQNEFKSHAKGNE
ncbi:MAG: hypothetical protein ACK5FX_09125 [Flavobacteriia bacterium]|jgi:hypothetical protein